MLLQPLALILALLLAPAAWANSDGPEDRCAAVDAETASGGHCRCAETFDTDTFVDLSPNPQDPNTQYYAPTNDGIGTPGDEGNGPKRCQATGQGPYLGTLPNILREQSTPGTHFPSGYNAWVWENAAGGQATQEIHARTSILSTSRTVCFRYYLKMSSDYPAPAACSNVKMARMFWPGPPPPSIQNRISSGGADAFHATCANWGDGIGCGSGTELPQTGSLTLSMCKGHWCRLELCEESDSTLTTGAETTTRMHVEAITGPNVGQVADTDIMIGTRNAGTSFEVSAIAEFYREAIPPGTAGCGVGTKWFSHAMHAEWDTNGGQWIGAASEVEGAPAGPTKCCRNTP